MLDVKDLTKRFGTVTALDRLSLRIEKGERIAIIGRSGAGKSTLLRSINRLETPTEGDILFGGESILALRGKAVNAWRARCAMIFQQFQLVPRLDVLTNVLVGRLHERPLLSSMMKYFPAEERAKAVIELDRLGMAETAFKRAQDLSGGQQQRVAIARAMVQDPEILLADEPIASLDPRNAHAVMKTLQDINEDRGITVVVNLHAIDIARAYCQRVIGLAQGQVVFDGSCDELDEEALSLIYDGPDPSKDEEQALAS
ncbi:MAG: phosphonate ABC transporter ATP-binding protein [Pseudomonadota bacterium]